MTSLILEGGSADLSLGEALVGGTVRTLTPKENALLRYLAERPSRVVAREDLMREVWEYSPTVSSRTLEVTVQRLRTKIELHPSQPVHLLTERNVGYRFELVAERRKPSLDTDEDCPAHLLPWLEAGAIFENGFTKGQLAATNGSSVDAVWVELQSWLEQVDSSTQGWKRFVVRSRARFRPQSQKRRERLEHRHLDGLLTAPHASLPELDEAEADILASAARFGSRRNEEIAILLQRLCRLWRHRGKVDLGRLDAILSLGDGLESTRLRIQRARWLATQGQFTEAAQDLTRVAGSRWAAALQLESTFADGMIATLIPERRPQGIALLESVFPKLTGEQRIECADRLASALISEDRPQPARRYLEIVRTSETSDPGAACRAEYSLAIAHIRTAEWADATAASDRSIALAVRAGEEPRLPFLLTLRGWLDYTLISYETGDRTFREARRWLDRHPTGGASAVFQKNLAEHQLGHGRIDMGRETLEVLGECETARQWLGGWLDELLGWLAIYDGDFQTAEAAFLKMRPHAPIRALLAHRALRRLNGQPLDHLVFDSEWPTDTLELAQLVDNRQKTAPKTTQLISRFASVALRRQGL